MKGLGVPVENKFGLRPATVKGSNQLVPLAIQNDLDTRGFLNGVSTFEFSLFASVLYYAVTLKKTAKLIHVLARQPIDIARIHAPFYRSGE